MGSGVDMERKQYISFRRPCQNTRVSSKSSCRMSIGTVKKVFIVIGIWYEGNIQMKLDYCVPILRKLGIKSGENRDVASGGRIQTLIPVTDNLKAFHRKLTF